MPKGITIFLIIIILLASSCNSTRFPKPLKKGEHAVTATLGGPLIKFAGAPIPLPLTSIAYGYGIDTGLTIFGSLHTTSLAFGNIQTDIGATYEIVQQKKWRPGISFSPVMNIIVGTRQGEVKTYPQLDLNCYWSCNKDKNLSYLTLGNWFVLSQTKAHNQPQTNHWLPSVALGNTWYAKRFSYTLEGRFIAPNVSNQNIIVDYITPFKRGALGIYFGIGFRK